MVILITYYVDDNRGRHMASVSADVIRREDHHIIVNVGKEKVMIPICDIFNITTEMPSLQTLGSNTHNKAKGKARIEEGKERKRNFIKLSRMQGYGIRVMCWKLKNKCWYCGTFGR